MAETTYTVHGEYEKGFPLTVTAAVLAEKYSREGHKVTAETR